MPPLVLFALSAPAADRSAGASAARSEPESLDRPPPALFRSLTEDFERRVCAAKARACAGAVEEDESRASEAWGFGVFGERRG